MSELLVEQARRFTARHDLRLAERVGFRIHGIVHVAEDNRKPGKTAIKVHRDAEPYAREKSVHERLR